MSAFIVEDKTINKIVGYLYFHLKDFPDKKEELTDLGYNIENNKDLAKLAEDMFDLNVRAVNCRYGEGEAEKFRPLNFKYIQEWSSGNISVLKAIHCWHYQCSEGDIPDTSELFKWFEELSDSICYRIVSNMPEYEAAEWN